MQMSGQDWSTVTISRTGRKQSAQEKNQSLQRAMRSGNISTERKFAAGENKSVHASTGKNMRKLDEETEEFKHDRVDRSLALAIQQARLAKKMTQKALATAINEKPQIVGEYESGRAIPNPQMIGRMERALGVRLPRGGGKKKGSKKKK
mmetsp:Transcript_6569/g.9930  ORF Transcript_6569/g.9930 Transcript_6569/m.9930 type:complete len:149 (-) Transcript_6569:24-470(-)|eukprot:CAMPEP_0113943356 /NCGR_PEP_ID=MMETSP1339-20121228/23205_1 /TAXON_ID=94617 /ORGANISM="Fibrocapsa japonica" /LENGTH=148 /DNA_ID=CAMNT_0000948205 /DNA_START=121 /DNA_END=567 /DNA_ORIENTATION=- /assembly_acc=CAM_ASM_000762